MFENLLNVTNINLFGNVISELSKLSTKVEARVAWDHANLQLSGHINIDGIDVEKGDKVLAFNRRDKSQNGLYVVQNEMESWIRAEEYFGFEFDSDPIIIREGNTYKNKSFAIKRIKRIVTPSSIVVTLQPAPAPPAAVVNLPLSINQITVGGRVNFLSTPVFHDHTDKLNVFAANLANRLNNDKIEGFSASSNGINLAITAPKNASKTYNGATIDFDSTNILVVKQNPPNDVFSNYLELTVREYKPNGRYIRRKGRVAGNQQLEDQLLAEDSRFARIYGFTYEGSYYDLPRPALFLVHGDGEPANFETASDRDAPTPARAPGATSKTGLAAADFDFADGLRVWSYDKADYTIRMDVETGMFEDVLLAAMLGGSGGFDSAGMNARGMNARGMNARGMNARGMNARGMNARGGGNSD